jgi:hypothetical protein
MIDKKTHQLAEIIQKDLEKKYEGDFDKKRFMVDLIIVTSMSMIQLAMEVSTFGMVKMGYEEEDSEKMANIAKEMAASMFERAEANLDNATLTEFFFLHHMEFMEEKLRNESSKSTVVKPPSSFEDKDDDDGWAI